MIIKRIWGLILLGLTVTGFIIWGVGQFQDTDAPRQQRYQAPQVDCNIQLHRPLGYGDLRDC